MSTTRKMGSWAKKFFGVHLYKNPKLLSLEEEILGTRPGVNPNTLKNLELYMTPFFRGTQSDTYSDIETFKKMKELMKEIKDLVAAISEEHYNLTDGHDNNLNYLWYMYYKGTKKDDFRPFIYMAELMLLKKLNYLTETEVQNVVKMMKSDDKDNLHIATLTIKNLRDLRIKEKGVYSKENANYTEVKQTYGFEILNHTVFMETMIEK